jgi:peroxiredoxin
MLVYQYEKLYPEVEQVQLEQKASYWKGTFTARQNSRIILLTFTNNEQTDNNNDSGYVVWLYDEKGEKLKGSNAALAALYRGFGSSINVSMPNEKVLELFSKDIETYPELLDDYAHLYFLVLRRTQGDTFADSIKKIIDPLKQKTEPTAGDLSAILAGMMITEDEDIETYAGRLRTMEPADNMLLRYDLSMISKEQDFQKALDQFSAFYTKFPEYETSNSSLSSFLYRNLRTGNADEVIKFLQNTELFLEYWVYDSASSQLLDSAPDKALTISERGIAAISNEINNLQSKPSFLTSEQWKDALNTNLGYLMYNYARALEDLGRTEEAIDAYEEGMTLLKEEHTDMNQSYVDLLLQTGDYQKALEKIESFIRSGKSTAKMKENLEATWKNVNADNTESYEEYYSNLLENAEVNLREKLTGEMIDIKAPQFSLEDLQGNQVSLADFKGKTVILDFWATWCGPCRVSFPAMQKAVEKFENDESVKFLFVNTWESAEDKRQNAADFIDKNNYPFLVLLDTENTTVTSYGVKGIPTKYIIDGNGIIRFESVGYNGNPEQLLDELSMMIELTQQ